MSLSLACLSASTSRRLEGTVTRGEVWCFSTAGAGPSAAAVSGKDTHGCVVVAHLRRLLTTVPPSERGSYDEVNRVLSDELNAVVVSVE